MEGFVINKKFDSIIVGLDYSSYSRKVLLQAQKLGILYNVPVTAVFTTIDPPGFIDISLPSQSQNMHKVIEHFNKFYQLKKKNIEAQVVYGYPEEGLIRIAKKNKNPLIVIGHKGHSVITRFFLGSTAERLILTSPFPIWIHRGNKILNPTKILVPQDLKKISSKGLLAANLFSKNKTTRTKILFVKQNPQPVLYYKDWEEHNKNLSKYTSKALALFRKAHPKVKLITLEGDPSEKIIKYGNNFDLIVMAPHTHKEKFHSMGKVTSKVVRGSKVPVLVAK